jgi:hypothetical protein
LSVRVFFGGHAVSESFGPISWDVGLWDLNLMLFYPYHSFTIFMSSEVIPGCSDFFSNLEALALPNILNFCLL